MNKNDEIKFIKSKDFKFIEELGRGACGKTIKLYDEIIDEYFVCKKYEPFYEEHKRKLFGNFVQEIKLLYLLNHRNVVRVFNYYIYPEKTLGYIIMECIEGCDIETHLAILPEDVSDLFSQCISGFAHLEKSNILHRDIRPSNIMVSNDGEIKIIDFGFGKRAQKREDFDKSISLNWWCELPDEFDNGKYDFSTEVYFVGKLFEKAIKERGIETFKYSPLLNKMCDPDPELRIKSFLEVDVAISDEKFVELEFSEQELSAYREFSYGLGNSISKIEIGCKYIDDSSLVQKKLEDCYKNVMLEEYLPSNVQIARCFLNDTYYYSKHHAFKVSILKHFVEFLRSCSKDKQNIVIANLKSRLDSIERYTDTTFDEDIPF